MPRKGRSNEEIIHALHQVEGGEKVTDVCRRLGVSEQTFYRWKKQFSGLGLATCDGRCLTIRFYASTGIANPTTTLRAAGTRQGKKS
jgi:transposase-like protein